MLQPFVVDRRHEPMEGCPIIDPFGFRIGADCHVTDECLAAHRAILAIKPESIPGAEIEPVPWLRLGIVRAITAPFAQPFFVGKILDQVSDPFVERFGALPR